MQYVVALAAAESSEWAQERFLRPVKAALESNLAQCLLKLERFEEAKVRAEAALALVPPGNRLHGKSLVRLQKAETALAHKRLAFAKAMHERLGDESELAELVERELFQTIAES